MGPPFVWIIENKEWLFSGIGVVFFLAIVNILRRWLSGRDRSAVRLSRSALKKLVKEFQESGENSAVNIHMIEEMTRGPRKIARLYLLEIVKNASTYSIAEREAAKIALSDLAEGRETRNLESQVAEKNPYKMSGQLISDPATERSSILAACVFWDRPTSNVRKQAFQMLLDDLKGRSSS